MSDQPEQSTTPNSLFLNAAIGFLSVLLLALFIGLFTRLIYPRISNQRAVESTELLGEIIQLEVLNGCGISGIANNFTGVLRKNGFDVVETGNFERFDLEKTIIISHGSSVDNAYRVAAALGVSNEHVIREESPDFYLDVSVVLGKDYIELKTN